MPHVMKRLSCNPSRIMRVITLALLISATIWSAPRAVIAAGSCKECNDQRRTCMSNYSEQVTDKCRK
jgi:hypothetical protein